MVLYSPFWIYFIRIHVKLKSNIMKKILLAVSALLFVSACFAQDLRVATKEDAVVKTYNKVEITGRESAPDPVAFSPIMRTNSHNFIGTTYYDCQSNGSVSPRVYTHADGTVSAVWTTGSTAANRGTGYNYFDGSSWVIPYSNTNRLESIKTGYPTMTCIGDVEITAAHGSGGLQIGICPEKGTSQWTFTTLPGPTVQYAHGSQTSDWLQWPYMVSTGNIIHLIACTESDTGYYYNGINCCLLYYRGTFNPANNTISWEDPRIVGDITADDMKRFNGDSYAIAAKGNTVAIAVTTAWYDSFLWKSTDQGQTFTKTVFCESPFKEDMAAMVDTCYVLDGCVAVAVGDDGKAHIAVASYLAYADSAEATSYHYWPSIGYCMVWNDGLEPLVYNNNSHFMNPEQLTAKGCKVIEEVSINCDTVSWYISGIKTPDYGTGPISMPQLIAQDGKVYVFFTQMLGVPFVYIPTGGSTGYHFRGVFGTKYEEGGDIDGYSWLSYNKDCYYLSSWEYFPMDTNSVFSEFFDYVESEGESVYPAVSQQIVNGQINMWWQQDFAAGCYIKDVSNAAISPDESYIYWQTIKADSIGIYNNTDEVCQGIWIDPTGISNHRISGMKMYPNPASESVNIAFSSEIAEKGVISVMNLMGQTVYTQPMEVTDGYNLFTIPVKQFNPGVYMVTVRTNTGISTQKLIVK